MGGGGGVLSIIMFCEFMSVDFCSALMTDHYETRGRTQLTSQLDPLKGR